MEWRNFSDGLYNDGVRDILMYTTNRLMSVINYTGDDDDDVVKDDDDDDLRIEPTLY